MSNTANNNFMKERPVLPLLLSMALPMVLSMLVNSLYNIIDSYFVAKISEDAMTALSLIFPVQNFISAAAIGFGIGINAVIAINLGAGDRNRANKAASLGLTAAFIHGIIFTIAGIAIIPWFLSVFTSNENVIALGIRYCRTVFSFTIVIMLGISFEKIFQSVGSMKVTMTAMMCGCIANIILDPLMIFGIGPFPAMGIDGAALATGIGQTLTLAIYIIVYLVKPINVTISPRYIKADKRIIARLYSVGVPATLNLALPSILISALNAILAAYSESYILVLGIYYKLQTFLYLPANGIIQGMRPIIGFNYGAGEHKRVKKIYYLVLCMTAAIMTAGTVICLLVPDKLIGLFSDNPATLSVGASALRIISAGFIISSLSVTSSGALEGLGKGFASLVISLCRYLVIILPAAYLLCRIGGASYVWHAFWIAEALTAFISVIVYRMAVKVR